MALKVSSPLIAGLAAESGWRPMILAGALAIYRDALQRYPQSRSLVYGYAEALLAGRQYEQGLQFLDSQLQVYSSDYKLYGLAGEEPSRRRASACSSTVHRPSSICCRGSWGRRSNSCSLRKRRATATFFEQSAVDARLRELRKLQRRKRRLNGG
jgi:predicted Zn-dependent protease